MDGVTYDLRKLVHALKPAGPLVAISRHEARFLEAAESPDAVTRVSAVVAELDGEAERLAVEILG